MELTDAHFTLLVAGESWYKRHSVDVARAAESIDRRISVSEPAGHYALYGTLVVSDYPWNFQFYLPVYFASLK